MMTEKEFILIFYYMTKNLLVVGQICKHLKCQCSKGPLQLIQYCMYSHFSKLKLTETGSNWLEDMFSWKLFLPRYRVQVMHVKLTQKIFILIWSRECSTFWRSTGIKDGQAGQNHSEILGLFQSYYATHHERAYLCLICPEPVICQY